MRKSPLLACCLAASLSIPAVGRAAPPVEEEEAAPAADSEAPQTPETPEDSAPPLETSDPDRERASELFEQGSSDYTLGNYSSAIEKFEEAYRLSNEPEMLYNLGQAYWKSYDVQPSVDVLRKARVLFLNYQKILGNQGDHSDEVERFIVDIEKQIEALGAELEDEPDEQPEPDPAANSDPTPQNDRKALGPMGFAGIGLAGVGALGGGTLVAVGLISASRLESQRDDERDHPDFDDDRDAEYDANIGKSRTMTYVAAGVGGALLVTGIVLIALDAAKRRKGKSTAFVPGVGPGGLSVRF